MTWGSDEVTHLTSEQTGGLGPLVVAHPEGTFSPSPASRVTLRAVGLHQDELAGEGLDWGCGVGLLAIAASRAARVERVTGLDLDEVNVAAARSNAVQNGAEEGTSFFVADSLRAVTDEGRVHMAGRLGRVGFLLANPPYSGTSDGFDFRRRLLRDAAPYLRRGALVLVQALSVYGAARVGQLCREPGGYAYEGVAMRSEVVPLHYGRASIRAQHALYTRAEAEGHAPYEFLAGLEGAEVIDARQAWEQVSSGRPVYARWQVHRFRRVG